MGQSKPVDSKRQMLRGSTREEEAAVDYVKWIKRTLGAHNSMIGYLTEMLLLEITDTPMREAKGELQCIGSSDLEEAADEPTFSI